MRGISGGRGPAVAGAAAVALLVAGCDLGAEPTTYPAASAAGMAGVGDVDGDGHLDIVTVGDDDGFDVLVGDGAGGFTPTTVPQVTECDTGNPTWTCRNVRVVGLADFNADERVDVVATYDFDNHEPPPYTQVYPARTVRLADGAGGFGPPSSVPVRGTFADVTGDGIADLVTTDDPLTMPPPTKLRVRPGNGAGGFGAPIASDIPGEPALAEITVADVNEDGHGDVLVSGTRVQGAGEEYLRGRLAVLLGDGSGTFTGGAHVVATDPRVDRFDSLDVGDLDEDGDLDIVAAAVGADVDGDARIGALAVFPGDGAGGIGPEVIVPAFEQTVGVQVADFDADGHLDLFTDTDDGDTDWNDDLGRLLFGDGDLGFPDLHVLPSGEGEVADLDADGKPDYARATADGVQVFLNRWDGRPE